MALTKLRLKGITKRGKEKVKQWGEVWIVRDIVMGRLMIVAESDKSNKTLPDSVRWVNETGDFDFELTKI